MNILYLHGLDSSLSDEKRLILERFGNILAPNIDYGNQSNAIEILFKKYQDNNINAIIGSSMGGFAGYYLSNKLQRPSLLFNPALVTRPVHQEVPNYKNSLLNLKYIVLGANDDVVAADTTLVFLSKTISENTEYQIILKQGLGHRIPLDVFEKEVECFFKKSCH